MQQAIATPSSAQPASVHLLAMRLASLTCLRNRRPTWSQTRQAARIPPATTVRQAARIPQAAPIRQVARIRQAAPTLAAVARLVAIHAQAPRALTRAACRARTSCASAASAAIAAIKTPHRRPPRSVARDRSGLMRRADAKLSVPLMCDARQLSRPLHLWPWAGLSHCGAPTVASVHMVSPAQGALAFDAAPSMGCYKYDWETRHA